jgi:hypothetical protein
MGHDPYRCARLLTVTQPGVSQCSFVGNRPGKPTSDDLPFFCQDFKLSRRMNELKFSGAISRVKADQKLTFKKTFSVSIIRVDNTDRKDPQNVVFQLNTDMADYLRSACPQFLSSILITHTDMDNTSLLSCISICIDIRASFKNNFKMLVESDMIVCG